MKNFFSLRIIFAATVLFFSINVKAQTDSYRSDSIMQINRKYRHEVGVDMSGLLQRSSSAALVFKRSSKSGRLNYRFQLGIQGKLPLNQKISSDDTSYTILAYKSPSSFGIFVGVGLERVKSFGRFNFYYGADLVPSYNASNSGYRIVSNGVSNPGSNGLLYESYTANIALTPFIGAKYRLSEHFSASIESALFISWFMSETRVSVPYYINGFGAMPGIVSKEETSGLNISMSYLRFLTLNYHL